MARPELGNTAREIYANTRPIGYADADTDYAWARFVSALSYLLDPIADVTRPGDGSESWTVLASPMRCPEAWLPVLAQWAGVRRPDAMSSEDLRELIGPHAPGMWRGTRAAMIAAVRRFMPPGMADHYLYFEERADGNPYALRVFTYESIEHDQDAVRTALLAAKPAGLNLIYETRRGQSWAMLAERDLTWGQVSDHYDSWAAVAADDPREAS